MNILFIFLHQIHIQILISKQRLVIENIFVGIRKNKDVNKIKY